MWKTQCLKHLFALSKAFSSRRNKIIPSPSQTGNCFGLVLRHLTEQNAAMVARSMVIVTATLQSIREERTRKKCSQDPIGFQPLLPLDPYPPPTNDLGAGI